MNTWGVFFLFPGRVWVVFCLLLGSETDKEPTGQKPLSGWEPSAVILNLGSESQYLFSLST